MGSNTPLASAESSAGHLLKTGSSQLGRALGVFLTLALVVTLGLATNPAPASAAGREYVKDSMSRTVSSGWGKADKGGTWIKLSSTVASVSKGQGWLTSPKPGRTSRVSLPNVARDVSSRFTLTIPKLPTSGTGVYLSHGVRVTKSGAYLADVRVLPGGAVELSLQKRSGTKLTNLKRLRLPQKVRAGSVLNIQLQTKGSTKVSLLAKAWTKGSLESKSSSLTYADGSATRIAGTGGVEFSLYTGSKTKLLKLGVDNLKITAPPVIKTPVPVAPVPKPVLSPPSPTPAQEGLIPGARAKAGAEKPGSVDHKVPAGAVIVSPSGSDSGAGTASSPYKTVTYALRKVTDGGTIALRGGSYHEFVLVPPQKRVTIQPYGKEAVWLDGAETVSGWVKSGSTWVRSGWTQTLDSSPTYKRGAADSTEEGWRWLDPNYPLAAHPDQVWLSNKELMQVGSLAAVSSGKFYVDEAKDQLVIGSDPTGKKVEASTLIQGLSVRSVGSVVKGIGVKRYAPSVPDMGAVIVAADNVSLSQLTIEDNSTTGLYTWAKNTTLTDVSLLRNGLLGGGASKADGLKLTRLLSVGNNDEHFNRAPVSGAFKIHSSTRVSVKDSVFADNFGQGPWFDESNNGVTFTGNDSLRNSGSGFVFELSENAVVADNLVANNGINGVYVINSGGVSVWNNTLVGNQRNIAVTMDKRRSGNEATPWITKNTEIVNNMSVDSRGDCLLCVDDRSRTLTGDQILTRAEGNLYQRNAAAPSKVFAYFAQGSAGPSKAYGTLEELVKETGREKRSKLFSPSASLVKTDYSLQSSAEILQKTNAVAIPAKISSVSRLSAGALQLGASFRR